MPGRGGKRKGAGRKSKGFKLLDAGFIADWFTSDFQRIKWKRLLDDEDSKVVADTMKYLTDRIYGKPIQGIAHTGAHGGPIATLSLPVSELTDEELAEIIRGE